MDNVYNESLVEKARKFIKPTKLHKAEAGEIELALAVLKDEVTIYQAAKAMNLSSDGAARRMINILRFALRDGRITISPVKPPRESAPFNLTSF